MSAQGRTELFETATMAKAPATMTLLFLLKATPHNPLLSDCAVLP